LSAVAASGTSRSAKNVAFISAQALIDLFLDKKGLFQHPKPIAVPAGNDVNSLTFKGNNGKSLRTEI
jgi:hypothetical protein